VLLCLLAYVLLYMSLVNDDLQLDDLGLELTIKQKEMTEILMNFPSSQLT
jgi:hypothetical protein